MNIFSFKRFSYFLTDADECNTSIRICDENADCKNTLGSYRCSCKKGFSKDEHTCQGRRGFISELTYLHRKCSITSQIWSFVKQVSTSLHQFIILRIHSQYKNPASLLLFLSHLLSVSTRQFTSTDIDECASSEHDCHYLALCTNTVGSFTCSCNHPYVGDGRYCNLASPAGKCLRSSRSQFRILFLGVKFYSCSSNYILLGRSSPLGSYK